MIIRPRRRQALPAADLLADDDDAIDVGVGERPQHHAVEHAENRSVGADPERERRDGDGGVGRGLEQQAYRVPHVGGEALHEDSS
jgi:hypothetical protein